MSSNGKTFSSYEKAEEWAESVFGDWIDKGSCLFQDIYGRTTEIKIDPLFKQFLTAFDSSIATEEER